GRVGVRGRDALAEGRQIAQVSGAGPVGQLVQEHRAALTVGPTVPAREEGVAAQPDLSTVGAGHGTRAGGGARARERDVTAGVVDDRVVHRDDPRVPRGRERAVPSPIAGRGGAVGGRARAGGQAAEHRQGGVDQRTLRGRAVAREAVQVVVPQRALGQIVLGETFDVDGGDLGADRGGQVAVVPGLAAYAQL